MTRFASPDLERAVLACGLMKRDHLAEMVAELEPRDFDSGIRRQIFAAARAMVHEGLEVDELTLAERTKGVEGAEVELAVLTVDLPDPSRFASYLEQLREMTARRDLHAYALGIQDLTSGEHVGIVTEAQQRLERIVHRAGGVPRGNRGLELARIVEALTEQEGAEAGTETGIYDLDRLTHGLRPGQLVILAGRPGMGKTSLAITVLRHVAFTGGAVAMSSLEMTARELALRIAAAETGMAYRDLHYAPDGTTVEKLVAVARALQSARVEIDDSAALTAPQIAARVYGVKRRLAGLDLVIVDYLQLIEPHTTGDSMAVKVGAITRSLKRLAKDLQVPVLALSQLSRQCEQRPSKKPILSDLRDSGAIEQDADLVLFLHRPEVYQATQENFGRAELIVAKNRNGATGTIDLYFHGRKMSFTSAAVRKAS